MRRAFGDSFFFIALLNPRDSFHQTAVEVSRHWEGQIITTRWVWAEVGNALCGVNARRSFTGQGRLQEASLAVGEILPRTSEYWIVAGWTGDVHDRRAQGPHLRASEAMGWRAIQAERVGPLQLFGSRGAF